MTRDSREHPWGQGNASNFCQHKYQTWDLKASYSLVRHSFLCPEMNLLKKLSKSEPFECFFRSNCFTENVLCENCDWTLTIVLSADIANN
jgi:hypothetical protein